MTDGHQVGDRVLLCAAQWFGKSVGSSDFIARYGGEEFVILLTIPNSLRRNPNSLNCLEKLQAQITSTSRIEKSEEQRVVAFTSSCGLAEFTVDESAEDLLRRADEALYVAKGQGKTAL